MLLNVRDGVFRKILVYFQNDAGPHVGVKYASQHGQCSRRRDEDKRLRFTRPNHALYRGRNRAREPMLPYIVPIGGVDSASAAKVNSFMHPPGSIGPLLPAWRACVFKHRFGYEIWKSGIPLIAKKQGFLAISNDYQSIVRNVWHIPAFFPKWCDNVHS
jgi:hypothetical protein